jgi:hypothetical protein
MASLMMALTEMDLASETEVLKEQIRVSWQAGQHNWMGTMSYRKRTHQAQSVGGLISSMTSQSMDYIR